MKFPPNKTVVIVIGDAESSLDHLNDHAIIIRYSDRPSDDEVARAVAIGQKMAARGEAGCEVLDV